MSQKYHMDDCVIAIPAGSKDSSMNMLEWELEGGQRMSLVVQRGGPLGAVTPEEFVESETKAYPTAFEGYRVEREAFEDGPWSGVVFHHKVFRWKKDADVFFNHQVFVFDGGKVILFTASARARHRDDVERLIETVLGELRFREE